MESVSGANLEGEPALDVGSAEEVKIQIADNEEDQTGEKSPSSDVDSSTATLPMESKEIPSTEEPLNPRQKHQGHSTTVELAVPSPASKQFAIEQHLKNTEKNPNKESTSVTPYFVRKAHSYEVLPRPFRTTNQFICIAYLSVLFCFCCGSFATKWAWQAKLQRNKGLYTVAKKSAKRALGFMIAAFIGGLIIMAVLLAVFV